MLNDMLLQRDVLAALDREESIIHGTIGVEVHRGVVKLAGRVGAEMIRERAEAVARNVAGVTTVITDIDVANVSDTRRQRPTAIRVI
jgi:osmotically-inducible protein OsmY